MTEAEDVFAAQVEKWRATSWRDLQVALDEAVAYSIDGSAGVSYQFEVLRTDGFIKAPDGTFVGR